MSSLLTHAMVSRFRNSFDSRPIADFNLEFALNGIRNGYYASAVEQLRDILARHGKAAYDRAKAHLNRST
jgi:hypothetical protein